VLVALKQKTAERRFFVFCAQAIGGFLSAFDYFNIPEIVVKCLCLFSPRKYGEAIAKKKTRPERVRPFFWHRQN